MRLPPRSFFFPCFAEQSTSAMVFDPVAWLVLLSLLRCQHRPLFVTSQSCSEFSQWLFLRRRIQAPDGGTDICSSHKSGGDGESCHLAKPSGALYVSDLHVSTCSKYNPLAFVDEAWALWLPEGETGREEHERQRWKERSLAGKHFWEKKKKNTLILAWITQQGGNVPSMLVKFTIFSRIKFW